MITVREAVKMLVVVFILGLLFGVAASWAEPVVLGERCDPDRVTEIAGVRVHFGPEPMARPPGHGCRESKVPEYMVDAHFPFLITLLPGETVRLPEGAYVVSYAVLAHPRRHMPDGVHGSEQVHYPEGVTLTAPLSPLMGASE
jgi:hypothetical protein